MKKIKRIVVGTSLTPASDPVVAAAFEIAERIDCELHLVHAYPMPVVVGETAFGGAALGGAVTQPPVSTQEKYYREELDGQLERLGADPDRVAETTLAIGTAHHLLLEAAEEAGADLILLGPSESKGPLAPLLGSTADRVLRKARRPILVVREGFSLPVERVLAPVDLSPLSEESLERGLEVLEELEGSKPAKVEGLFVLSRIDREGSAHFTPDQVDRFAWEELDRFLGRVGEHYGGTVEPALRSGVPREEIVEHLEHNPADLLILGTHGRSGFERFLLGSVAADVLRHVDASVLVVPPEGKKS